VQHNTSNALGDANQPGRGGGGKVYLVGAGPGDPGLITLRGAECLAQADLILCDPLVNSEILRHANPSADIVLLGRHSGGLSSRVADFDSPEKVRSRMVHAAHGGLNVVLLKGGGPSVLGGAADEIQALEEAGVPFEIVPGVAASLEVSRFAAGPLFGVRVLVTRPGQQADEPRRRLAELGAEVLLHPVIRIGEPPDWTPVDQALDQLDRYDWLVFSSVNGVHYLFDRLFCRGGDLRRLGHVKLAAIGGTTAEKLEEYHLRADLVPDEYRAEGLAESLISAGATLVGKRKARFLLARASRGREVLAERLAAAGAEVDQVVVYSSVDVEEASPEVAEALAAGSIDWITVTSSAIARALHRLFGDHLRRSKLVSISPVTSQTLRQFGYEPAVQANVYTMEGVVEAILGH